MVKAMLLGAFLLPALAFMGTARGQTFEEGLAAYQAAMASKDMHDPGYAKAFSIWTKLAASGDAAATYHLGVLYLYGLGGAEFDQMHAFALIRAAAEGGYPQAESYMGLMSERGDGLFTLSDPEQALQWYEKAEAAGHCYSVRRLARAHERGELGLKTDPEAARALRAQRPQCFDPAS